MRKFSEEYVKKKIMFSTAEDVYFITYHLIVILIALQCDKNGRYLKDYNKLALLITISEKKQYREVIKKILENQEIDILDKQVVFEIYYNSSLRKRNIRGVIFTLNSKGIINLRKNGRTIDVTLTSVDVRNTYKENILFEEDLQFYDYIREKVLRLTSITLDTMEKRILGEIRGAEWDTYQ